MGDIKLGRLERVNIRSVFEREDQGFSNWLKDEENLACLGDAVSLQLEFIEQEKWIGPYRLDLLCKNADDDTWVVIENQFGKTNHDHLGKLITYASALEPVSTIIWIAETFTDEHRGAIDWLNKRTPDDVQFLGIEIELLRIGKSDAAPRFNIKAQKNQFSQAIRTAATLAENESEHRQLQYAFWTEFRKFMEESHSSVSCQKAHPRHWMVHKIGRSFFHLSSVISTGRGGSEGHGPELRVELVVWGKDRFKALEAHKAEIEKSMGMPLFWHNPEHTKKSKVLVRTPGDFTNQSKWPEQQQWLKTNLEKFQRVFEPIVRNLNFDDDEEV